MEDDTSDRLKRKEVRLMNADYRRIKNEFKTKKITNKDY